MKNLSLNIIQAFFVPICSSCTQIVKDSVGDEIITNGNGGLTYMGLAGAIPRVSKTQFLANKMILWVTSVIQILQFMQNVLGKRLPTEAEWEYAFRCVKDKTS